ncbi:TetR/AcrR family transcriptional regulator [Ancylobacter sp. 6x-1]|uniref:TetR/AcrR family transcriptional regulator n=1 Tax=Ancylobacter crimeensis TaxID=2579147 RepID=A0ABT0DD15_9HYPH|nr:TetR/AcrR family transcriptional regulator [Ancylobacter crimeensis]MCK0197863.1 TetR/AcrR family transcriptional regulator [Ancylobacter crimeensis]
MSIAHLATPVAPSRGTPDPAAPPRKDPQRRVLDAAIACFIRAGFHATSMQEICAAAGMSPGALYRYFPSKEAIIIAIVEQERSARAALLDHLATAPSFIAALEQMGAALFAPEMQMVCAELGPEISAEAARNPKLRPIFQEVEDEANRALLAALRAAQARGEVDAALEPAHVLLVINALGDGLLLRRRFDPGLPLGAMMPGIADLLGRMLAPRTPAPTAEGDPA